MGAQYLADKLARSYMQYEVVCQHVQAQSCNCQQLYRVKILHQVCYRKSLAMGCGYRPAVPDGLNGMSIITIPRLEHAFCRRCKVYASSRCDILSMHHSQVYNKDKGLVPEDLSSTSSAGRSRVNAHLATLSAEAAHSNEVCIWGHIAESAARWACARGKSHKVNAFNGMHVCDLCRCSMARTRLWHQASGCSP